MCGIVGFCSRDDTVSVLIEGLEKLEYRGYDSAGVAIVGENGMSVCKSAGKVEDLVSKIKEKSPLHGKTGVGHTRWATHGKADGVNAHPHLSQNGKIAVVHNGIIENCEELRKKLERDGYVFKSETDTEVIAHLLQKYNGFDFKDAIVNAVTLLKGSFALGIINEDCPDRLYAVSKSSPIVVGVGDAFNCIASDVLAFSGLTDKVVCLNDGEIAEITPFEIKIFDFNGNKVERELTTVSVDMTSAERGEYEHYMLKEINEQPIAFERTLKSYLSGKKLNLNCSVLDKNNLVKYSKIVITACGSAYYAGCAARYCIEKLCRIHVYTELASELRYGDSLIGEETLVIAISQSGETADTIAAIKECKRLGAKTLAVVNVADSTIAREADDVICTCAGREIAVATTKGYTSQLAALYLIAVDIAYKTERIDKDKLNDYISRLLSVPDKMQKVISSCKNISELSKKYCEVKSMFFIGRNTDYATALEGALKMKEISYIHAECYAAGELKHGTIALIEEGTPVVALCFNNTIMEKTINNMIEVKSRGAEVVAVTTDREKLDFADEIIELPESDSLFGTAIEIIPLQLFAYYTAKEKECDIDKPKNLAKSVTVE